MKIVQSMGVTHKNVKHLRTPDQYLFKKTTGAIVLKIVILV